MVAIDKYFTVLQLQVFAPIIFLENYDGNKS